MSGAPANGPRDDASRLLDYVRDVARLRREIEPYERDCRPGADGDIVYYAIDTNILNLYVAPQRVGPKTSTGGAGYGVVFHDDSEDDASALGAAFSRFVIHRLSKRAHARASAPPLVLLPGHDAETRGLFDQLIRRAETAGRRANEDLEDLRSDFALLEELKTVEERAAHLRERAPHLISTLFYTDTPWAEFRRMNTLITGASISKLALATQLPNFFRPETGEKVKAAFAKPANLVEQLEESRYRNAWYDLLRSSKNKDRKPARLIPDSHALARLEIINRHLKPFSTRLVLITGDEGMFDVGAAYQPFGDETFADLYLRHPRAFLAADEVLVPGVLADETTPDLSMGIVNSWLDTLLARFTDDEGVSREQIANIEKPTTLKRLRERVGRMLKEEPTIAGRIKSEWAHHTRALTDQHSATSGIAAQELRRVLGKSLGAGSFKMLSDLDNELSAASAETWQSFFETLASAGFSLTVADGVSENDRKRNVPPLTFSSWPKTSAAIMEIVRSDELDSLSQAQINALTKTADREDKTGYARMLVFGLLFALAGRWHVAAVIAKRALELAELSSTFPPDGVEGTTYSGREAYYFRAVALRHGARRGSDLAGIDALLEQAKDAYRKDKKARPRLPVTVLRFDGERLALALTELMFATFVAPEPSRKANTRKATELLRQLLEMDARLDELKDPWIRMNVERNILTNTFMTCALLEAEQKDLKPYREQLRLLATRLDRTLREQKKELPPTFLVQAVHLYSMCAFGPAKDLRTKLRNDIQNLRWKLQGSTDKWQVMPYDAKRYELLARLAEEKLNA